MVALQPATVTKLGKLLPLLGSDKDGEVVATARAMIRILEKSGACLHDVVTKLEAPPAERIVYREKVVYREREAPASKPRKSRAKAKASPKSEAEASPRPEPEKDLTIGFEEVLRIGEMLLQAGGLSEREHGFVKHMMDFAHRLKERSFMTVRQAAWWRVIVDESGVIDPLARSA